jgi:hypothetical protein
MKRIAVLATAGILAFGLVANAEQGIEEIPLSQVALQGKVVSKEGDELAGVTIKVRSKSTGFEKVALTGRDGSFRVVGLPAGRYEVEAAAEGFGTVSLEVTLRPGTITPLTIELPVGVPITGTIAGVVRSDAGSAIAGASVMFSGPDGREKNTQTSEGGAYRQAGLYPGSWRVVVEAAGYHTAQQAVEVRKRGEKEVNFKLKKKEKGADDND